MSEDIATRGRPEGFPTTPAGGGGGVPSPGAEGLALIHDGGQYPTTPAGYTEQKGGGAKFSALRLGSTLFIRAQGMVGYFAQVADIRQAPIRIYPPAFDFLVYTPHGELSTLVRHYDFFVRVGFPKDPKAVVIRDAQGSHQVPIAEFFPLKGKAPLVDFANAGNDGFGMGDSLEEAITSAVESVPPPQSPPNPDQMFIYKVTESGKMIGGFAALNVFYARVSRQGD
jgi:hypothetical protein